MQIWSTLIDLPSVLFWACVLWILWRLLSVARSQGPFTSQVAAATRRLGWFIIVGTVAVAAVHGLALDGVLNSLFRPAVGYGDAIYGPIRALLPVPAITGAAILTFARIIGAGQGDGRGDQDDNMSRGSTVAGGAGRGGSDGSDSAAAAHDEAAGIRIRLDELLARCQMTLTELSERVGITIVNLSILKNGHARAIRFSTLARLCAALDCQPGDLLVRRTPIEADDRG